MTTLIVKLVLGKDQEALFREAKRIVESELGGGISEEQAIHMLLMQGVRETLRTEGKQ